MKPIRELAAVAQNRMPAEFAVRGATVFNVFTGTFEHSDVLVVKGWIAAVLPHEENPAWTAASVTDGTGYRLVPGFIDAHVHMESGMVCPEEFAAVAAANGITALAADPHEICNVLGVDGLRYMLEATRNALARVFFLLPSCVPAGSLEQAAHTLGAADLAPFLGHPRVLGLGEMMNYPGVLQGFPDVMDKLESIQRFNEAAFGALSGMTTDGHAPFVSGKDLQAYAAAGIRSDHEASSVAEGRERLAAGMALMMRDGSAAKNLLDLVPVVDEHTAPLCLLCTDDRHPKDLVDKGGINFLVRKLVRDGRLPLSTILKMASYNTARYFGLRDLGAVAPGYAADFALYPLESKNWKPHKVWCRGECVAVDGKTVRQVVKEPQDALRNSVHLPDTVGAASLRVPDTGKAVKVIETVPFQLITRKHAARLPSRDGFLQADPANDIAKLAVFERHTGSGRVGLGFIKGLGMRRGAVASTVAHDSHNLVVAGMNDDDMALAVTALRDAGGGFAVCDGGCVKALLPLPLAGLLSDKTMAEVYEEAEALDAAVRELGLSQGSDPFMTLAFMTLSVIPSLKLTDGGLVDGDSFTFTSLYVEDGVS